MKKKVLPLAVGTATAVVMSAANAAMYVNDKGMGETLIFPFYSAENGNSTNVNIANTTTGTKAVKVRILEAQNSREVLDFNLYLSPKDHFSFAVLADAADGGGMLKTNDNSCTVPAIPSDGVKFRDFLYNPADSAEDDADTEADESYDNTSITRTAVGYIEVIEMGQIDPDANAVLDTATQNAINAAAAIKHGSDGVPANCALLVDAWSTAADGTNGQWLAEAIAGTPKVGTSEFLASWAGGGLYGYASVVNVDMGTSFGYDAIAIADHVANGATGSAMHYEPGDINPNFTNSAFDTSAIVNNAGTATTVDFTAGGSYAAGVAQVQALNATMMALAVHNDYVTDPGLAATTDWLLTFPTKAFHVNGTEPIEPFSELWTGQSACEYAAMDMIDREESTAPPPPSVDQSGGPDFSPKPPPGPAPADPTNGDLTLCYEATIVQFAEESAVGTSSVAVGVNAFLDSSDGWGTISFDPADLFGGGSDVSLCGRDGDITTTGDQKAVCDRKVSADAHTLTGLPVVGFAVQKYVNGELGSGTLANYAMSTVHKTTIDLS